MIDWRGTEYTFREWTEASSPFHSHILRRSLPDFLSRSPPHFPLLFSSISHLFLPQFPPLLTYFSHPPSLLSAFPSPCPFPLTLPLGFRSPCAHNAFRGWFLTSGWCSKVPRSVPRNSPGSLQIGARPVEEMGCTSEMPRAGMWGETHDS